MIHLHTGARSHVGRLRDKNQDCAFVSAHVVAIADGMGGPPGGDVASLLAVQALRSALADPDITTLADAFRHANADVWESAAHRGLRGMGTTMCAVALIDDGSGDGPPRVAIANVGDSRTYLLRDGELELRTEDHSLVEEMVRDGRLTPEEALAHGQRNIVTRAIGIAPDVEVDSWELDAVVGDRYLLCSDGLFNEVDESRIAATLRRLADPDEAAAELVSLANQGGGRDNITCAVVDIVDGPTSDRSAGYGDRVIVPRPESVADLAGFLAAAPEGESRSDGPHHPHEAGGSAGPDATDRSMLPERDDPVAPRVRLVTWRTGAFVLAVVGVFVVAGLAVVWYGNSGYFVDVDDDGAIAVFEGRPGGFLWFEPSLVESTGVDVEDLTPVLRDSVAGRPEFSTFDDARRYLANLAEQLDRARPATTTTTSPSAGTTTTTTTTVAGAATTTTGP